MNFLDIIFPPVCLGCKKTGRYLCPTCLSRVEVLNKFDSATDIFSVFKYEGVIQKAIIKIKYSFAYDIVNELADITATHILNSTLNTKNSLLVPIPLHTSRQNWRGFNQSELLGKKIAKKLTISFDKNLLIRPIKGKTQVGLAYSERVRNICGKFAVNPEHSLHLPSSQKIIVFDDVATTGSTLKEAVSVLTQTGFSNVTPVAVAS